MTHAERVAHFDWLRARYLRLLTAVLWRLTGDRELFAEAMQYALLGLWRHVEKLKEDRAASYIYRIALTANAKACGAIESAVTGTFPQARSTPATILRRTHIAPSS